MEQENKDLENRCNELEVGVIVPEDSMLRNLGYNFLPILYGFGKGALGVYVLEHIQNPYIKGISAAYLIGSAIVEGLRFLYIGNTKDKEIIRSGLIPVDAIVVHNLRVLINQRNKKEK